MRRVVTLLFALMASLLVATGSAGAADPALKERVLATVNGKPLTAEMLAFYTQRRNAASPMAVRRATMRAGHRI